MKLEYIFTIICFKVYVFLFILKDKKIKNFWLRIEISKVGDLVGFGFLIEFVRIIFVNFFVGT